MKRFIIFTLLFSTVFSQAQQMTNELLHEIIEKNADTLAGVMGNWKFVYK